MTQGSAPSGLILFDALESGGVWVSIMELKGRRTTRCHRCAHWWKVNVPTGNVRLGRRVVNPTVADGSQRGHVLGAAQADPRATRAAQNFRAFR